MPGSTSLIPLYVRIQNLWRDSHYSRKCPISVSDPDTPAFGTRFALVRPNSFAALVAPTLSEKKRFRLGGGASYSHNAHKVQSLPIVVVAVVVPFPRVSGLSKLLGVSPSLYGSCPITLFPNLQTNCLTMTFSPFGMCYRFVRSSPLPWLTSQGCPLQYFIDDRFSARMRAIGCQEF